jgi:xanthosine utilization system XapX-like protein
MDDEDIWRKRFAVFMAVRLLAVVLVLAGLGIWIGDYVRPGGWPLLGAALVAVGLFDGLIVPRLLKRRWDQN